VLADKEGRELADRGKRGGRRWFPKSGRHLISKTKSVSKKLKKNENKEEWCRGESKCGNFILKDNYGN